MTGPAGDARSTATPDPRSGQPDVDAAAGQVWRCFVALPVPPGVADALDSRLARVRASSPTVRWLSGDQLHLTLTFIGAMPAERRAALEMVLADVASQAEPFVVELNGAGRFGGRGRQEVAWIGIGQGRASYVALAQQVSAACRAIGVLPAAGDSTSPPVRPHLTVARRSTTWLPTLIEAAMGASPLTWRADALLLYRSHLGAPAVRYEALAWLPLGPDLPSGQAGD